MGRVLTGLQYVLTVKEKLMALSKVRITILEKGKLI